MTGTEGHADDVADFDLTDAELRASGRLKWSVHPDDVLPAWVADLDLRPALAVRQALHEAIDTGRTTYGQPTPRTGLVEAFVAFQQARHGWAPDPGRVVLVGDVVGGLELVLRVLTEPGPVVVPVPNYGPFFDLARHLGRRVVPVPHRPDHRGRPTVDPEALERAFEDGARTLLLSQPQNPLGRAFDADELGAWVAIAARHGARVVSDEIWGPLTPPPAVFVSAASVPGAEGVVTVVTSPAKTFNLAGLKAALVITSTADDTRALAGLSSGVNHGWSTLGVVAAVAAYRQGGPWLDSVLSHLVERRAQLTRLVDARLPGVRTVAPEATFLAWLDTTALELDDPYRAALERGRVALSPGPYFAPPEDGGADARTGTAVRAHVRLNFGTSEERLERIVDSLARAWSPDGTAAGSPAGGSG